MFVYNAAFNKRRGGMRECSQIPSVGDHTVLSYKFKGTSIVLKSGTMAWIGSGLTWLEGTRACPKILGRITVLNIKTINTKI